MRRTRSRSLVSTVLPPLGARPFLGGAGAHQLVEHGAFALALAQDAPEPLHVLTHGPRAAQHDRHVRLGHIDPLVEHLGGDHHPEIASVEGLEDPRALAHLGLVGDGGHQEARRDVVDGGVVLGEDDGAIVAMGVVTLLYTYVGGLKAVIWADVIQLGVYVAGGIVGLWLASGMAGGVGPMLDAAGAAGKRYSLPNSRVMIHQPLGGFQGQASDIDIHAREILKMRDRLNEILAHHTGQPIERVAQDTDRDNFMGAADAAKYGLIDKVVEKRAESTVKPG